MSDPDASIDVLWHDLAAAEVAHDKPMAQHCVDELRRLGQIPEQRTPHNPAEFTRAVHTLGAGIADRTPARWRMLLAQVLTGQPQCLCDGRCGHRP